MNILLSSFACSPKWGSETGVGWYWAMELARTHQVTLVTHAHFRSHMEELPAGTIPPSLTIVYVAQDPILGKFHEQLLNSPAYYFKWQFKAFAVARRLVRQQRFDLAHHITWGTFRLPGLFPFLGLPSVLGPLGGAERAPMRLYAGLPWRERVKEFLRDGLIWVGRVDPFSLASLTAADLIYCKTRQTLAALAPWVKGKASLAQEIGAPSIVARADDSASAVDAQGRRTHPFQLLFAGRLIGLKGVHLGLRAVAKARQRGANVHYTVIGSGPMREHLLALADSLGLQEAVTFIPQIPQQELFARYAAADAFLFPSLHDSSGNVVLESFSRGVPVICLELGGPAEFVDARCGAVVPVGHASMDEVTTRMAETIVTFCQLQPQEMAAYRQAAYARAQALSWANQVARLYSDVAARLGIDEVRTR